MKFDIITLKFSKLALSIFCILITIFPYGAYAADKVFQLSAIPENLTKHPQSETSKKHRIRQRAFLTFDGTHLKVHFEIRNKDRYAGRTMCSKVEVIENEQLIVAAVATRAGISARGNHTRYIRFSKEINIPDWADKENLEVKITDWHCPKGFGSRLGDTFTKAVTKPVSGALEFGGEIISLVGTLKDKGLAELSYSMKKLGGKDWQKTFDDIVSLTRLVDDKLAVEMLSGVKSFVDGGDASNLNPLSAFVAAQMMSARAELYRKAKPVPDEIMSLLPHKIRKVIGSPRYIEKSRVAEISLPHFALSEAKAVVVEDVIAFRDNKVPDPATLDGKYLWLHELYHVYQYRSLGTAEFAKRYIGNELGFEAVNNKYPGLNTIEVEADLFACLYVEGAVPAYILTCPS